MTVNSAEVYIAACVSGMGLIKIPEYAVSEWLPAGVVCQVMPTWLAQPLPVSIVYPSRRYLSRPLQRFIAWLEPLLREKMRLTVGA
ncbi:LysR substrate-binding domain-containing protein [Raoultella terrigena]|uniref:LysR substrate-binding domain-containing protein n=1 Tax=Raoultella terrigena TaxID=577 RepID=UPI0026DD2717|nr:LysR substrate-binding domain-containing protein [Raoultella terrigena]